MESNLAGLFNAIAKSYDAWYDRPGGHAIFNAELACLRMLVPECRGRWLEVGVGSGRFAVKLGISEGVDPSQGMLDIAASRGIRTKPGCAEALPFPARSVDGVLLVLALCFVANVKQAFSEISRVLRPGGILLLGIIPGDGPWGQAYRKKAEGGHCVYAHARFRTVSETVVLAEEAGLELKEAASTLFWPPGEAGETEPCVRRGVAAEAGFVGLLFRKPRSCQAQDANC